MPESWLSVNTQILQAHLVLAEQNKNTPKKQSNSATRQGNSLWSLFTRRCIDCGAGAGSVCYLWETVPDAAVLGWKLSALHSASAFALRVCPAHCVKILPCTRDLFLFFPRRIPWAQFLSKNNKDYRNHCMTKMIRPWPPALCVYMTVAFPNTQNTNKASGYPVSKHRYW